MDKMAYLKDNWGEVWEKIADKVRTVFQKIVEFVKKPINWIIEKINGVFAKIGSIKIPDWVPGIGGKEFSLPQIPTLANGGLVEGGQLFEARESGPELVGSYGRQSAVMNNEQIVDAVARGVADAVAKVINNSNLANEIAKAIASSPIIAHISENEVFDSMVDKNNQYREITGRTAF